MIVKEDGKAVDVCYFAPVMFGEFDAKAEAFKFKYDSNHYSIVGARHLAKTISRLQEGYSYVTADPVHAMTRTEAAYLLANAEKIMKEINGYQYLNLN